MQLSIIDSIVVWLKSQILAALLRLCSYLLDRWTGAQLFIAIDIDDDGGEATC